ncbi:low molecular weight phosphatase family protein [Litorihabitans aurantiacus]|uniref:Low molecular weight phosphatase family protein n=1 Tax=Litorihabitans aurantiacus TaxID=1930061 RepID=A0AA37UN77_9MICO|nr:low molecular weight phosphatase family protein [Litorihabitans aurantiacus]GMA30026.1 low molecular weight phosphatase family protein [Litorihabitans aurantiacus]GMA33472.1 low molecular weight phosphatase family protein [Litorihabitans aurantiacus]
MTTIRDQDRTVVLFVCVRNSGKSQIAAALARRDAPAAVEIRSAGTAPAPDVSAEAAAVVEQVGATCRGEYPKELLAADLGEAGRVVLLGGEVDVEPLLEELDRSGASRPAVERWELDEPSERGVEGLERLVLLRDDIAARVEALLADVAPR